MVDERQERVRLINTWEEAVFNIWLAVYALEAVIDRQPETDAGEEWATDLHGAMDDLRRQLTMADSDLRSAKRKAGLPVGELEEMVERERWKREREGKRCGPSIS